MTAGQLEHVNITVTDADATAARLCRHFDWRIRWQGDAIHGGRSVHVGSEDSYLAVFSPQTVASAADTSYAVRGGLNHVGVVVDDLDAVLSRIREDGYVPGEIEEYEPGRRFYFRDEDEIEFEVVSYA